MSYTPTMFLSILPEILILVLGVLLLVFEPFWKGEERRNAGWMTAGGLLAIMAISLLIGRQSSVACCAMIGWDSSSR